MKKQYTTPTTVIKEIMMAASDILCMSGNVTNGSRNDGYGYEYIEGESDNGWNIGSPD